MRAQLTEAANGCRFLWTSLWVRLWELLDLLLTRSKIIRACLGTRQETRGYLLLLGKDEVRGDALPASHEDGQIPVTSCPQLGRVTHPFSQCSGWGYI